MAKKRGKANLEDMYSVYEEYKEPEEELESAPEEIEQEEEQDNHEDLADSRSEIEKPQQEKPQEPTVAIINKLERIKLGAAMASQKPQKVEEKKKPEKKATNYRSPICCILGHVDTGKTKILDRIRETEVQLSEAGGITQQIGATYVPIEELEKKYGIRSEHLPGLLVIDTPGHEAFSNLRTRGSSMCNMVVLVIDIMHGLEQQTRESIEILRKRKTPFVIALNKIDRIEEWKSEDGEFSIKRQNKKAQEEFKERYDRIVLSLSEEGLNSAIFIKNPDPKSYISIVPTSAVTGEGIRDLLGLIVSLVETRMLKKVAYDEKVECMVLEARSEEGKAPTIDVILSNGILSEGDRIVLCTHSGGIETVVRKLLTPHPMRETRVKSKYTENKQVRAAIGVRIVAPKLEGALAGSKLYVVKEGEAEEAKKKVEGQIRETLQSLVTGGEGSAENIFDVTGENGIHAQASTLGSLEALIIILKGKSIPIRTVGVGNISKRDVIKASTVREKHPEYSAMLCFDVKPSPEMKALAKELQVKIMTADIIYHLTEAYRKHMEEFWERQMEILKEKVVFPCILEIVPNCVFTKRSPLVLGVKVEEGTLRVGTPLAVVREGEVVGIGKIASVLEDTKQNPRTDKIPQGGRASIKVEVGAGAAPVIVGKKFLETDKIYSRLTRESIDILKESFKDALSKEEWMAVIKIKSALEIP